ncbi:AAA family ATPase [Plantactinospora sp. ZYX-F-223]|uniref:AAA family ATPase n=1 Tax=Plantactinospora sp. ZYX-F-223 TaxID=3144103 RepID=UPI0031FBFEC9
MSVVGNSGSGKSTLARALAARLRVPYVELDAIHHQPNWQPLPATEFRARVDTVTANGGWVVDGNYSAVRDLVWRRADTVVWVDPDRHTVMRQVVWRTLRRAALRAELWNGNRERWGNFFATTPDESVIVWAWQRHSVYRARYLAASADPAWRHLTFVRIRSRTAARRLLAEAAVRAGPES